MQGFRRPGLGTGTSLPLCCIGKAKPYDESRFKDGKIAVFIGEAEKSHWQECGYREEWLFSSGPHHIIYVFAGALLRMKGDACKHYIKTADVYQDCPGC